MSCDLEYLKDTCDDPSCNPIYGIMGYKVGNNICHTNNIYTVLHAYYYYICIYEFLDAFMGML